MVKIKDVSIGDAVFAAIEWPENPDLMALLSGILEMNKDLGLTLESEINHLVAQTATVAFHAGFVAGCNPVKLLFTQE